MVLLYVVLLRAALSALQYLLTNLRFSLPQNSEWNGQKKSLSYSTQIWVTYFAGLIAHRVFKFRKDVRLF